MIRHHKVNQILMGMSSLYEQTNATNKERTHDHLANSTSLYIGDTAVPECEGDDDDNVAEQQDVDITCI